MAELAATRTLLPSSINLIIDATSKDPPNSKMKKNKMSLLQD